jgi:ribosomal protein L21
VDGAAVQFEVVRHYRGPKGIHFLKRSKKAYKKKRGFRAELTELLVKEIRWN